MAVVLVGLLDADIRAREHLPESFEQFIMDSSIDINHCEVWELERIPNIGEVLAGRIDEYRRENTVTEYEQLLEVKGIGAKTLESIVAFGWL